MGNITRVSPNLLKGLSLSAPDGSVVVKQGNSSLYTKTLSGFTLTSTSIDSTPIGNTVRSSGKFTTLDANGASTFASVTVSGSSALQSVTATTLTASGAATLNGGTTTTTLTSSGNTSLANNRWQVNTSGIVSSVVPGGSTLYPQYPCRAWINFDGSSASVRGSGNLSVTRYGQGGYDFVFTTPLPDAVYSVLSLGSDSNPTTTFPPNSSIGAPYSLGPNGFGIRMLANNDDLFGSNVDKVLSFVAVFR